MGESRYKKNLNLIGISPRTYVHHHLMWGLHPLFLLGQNHFFIQYSFSTLKKVNLNCNLYIWKDNTKIKLTCFRYLQKRNEFRG